MHAELLLIALLELGTGAGPLPGVRVTVRNAHGSASSEPVAVVARPAISVGNSQGASVRVRVARGEAVLPLAAGAWTITVEGPGSWAGRHDVYVREGGQASPPVSIDVWPARVVTGRVKVPSGAVPESLKVVFSTPPGQEPRIKGEETTECPVENEVWTCRLPAATLDLQFRSKPLVPEYRWDLDLGAKGQVDLGTVTLRSGASVAGWVKPEAGQPLPVGCRVRLATPAGTPIERAKGEDADPRGLDAPVNRRGFFQIVGVAPADYLVTAEHATQVSSGAVVRVYRDSESVLLEPLRLAAPVTLDLALNPPRDPWGEAWNVALFHHEGHRTSPVRGVAFANQHGEYQRKGLLPGSYTVVVAASEKRWLNQSIDLRADSGRIRLELPVLRVRGTVTLDKKPLPSRVIFGGAHGVVSVPMEADEGGAFHGLLPQDAAVAQPWDIDVEAENPRVKRSLEGVEVRAGVGGEAEVEIALPATRLEGTVVDERGKPRQGIVDLQDASGNGLLLQDVTDTDGRFEFNGVAPGAYLASAQGRGGQQSEQVAATVPEGAEVTGLRLVLRDRVVVKGQVVSTDGAVPGARVKYAPAQNPLGMASVKQTDSDGRFEAAVPAETREIVLSVAAPGYAFRSFRAPIDPNRPLTILVARGMGVLLIETSGPASEMGSVRLLHAGAVESVSYLSFWSAVHGEGPEGNRMTIPAMEPGDYQVCVARTAPELVALAQGNLVSPDRCVRAFLETGGEAVLKVPGGGPTDGSPAAR